MRPLKTQLLLASIALIPSITQAATTVSGAIYTIDESVDFSVSNNGAQNFFLSWTDPGGAGAASFANVSDPTLVLTVGQTYTFERTTVSHPFAITTTEMSVVGSDGAFSRTSFASDAVAPFVLSPSADFTAEPSNNAAGEPISWTPTAADVGDYWYTCTITNHRNMTGKISVVPEPSTSALGLLAVGFLVRRRR